MQAKTVAQVVAAEAGGKTHKDRLSAMRDVFSAMVNRAQLTGQSLQSVISGRKQFDAYSKKMPAGTPAYVGLAQEAIDDVMANGTTLPPDVTYYAREYATKNLPKGLKAYKTAVDRHVYFSDPKNRAIVTAAGAKKPSMARMKETLAKTVSVVPESRPSSQSAVAALSPSSVFDGFQRPAKDTTSNFPGMSIPADTASPHTMADLGGLGAALSKQQALAQAMNAPPSDFASRPEQIAPNSQPLPDIPGLYSRNLEQRLSAVAGPGFGAQSLEHQLAKALGMVGPDAQPSGFMARPEQIAANTMRPGVDVASTPAEVDRLSREQMAAQTPSSFPGRPDGPLGQTPGNKEGRAGKGAFAAPGADLSPAQFDNRFGPTQNNTVASFTPSGPMTNDVYTPSTPSSVDPNAGYADPMQVASAKEWGAKQAATVDPNTPETYAQQGEDRAGWQADKAARHAAATQLAATVAASAAPQFASATPTPTTAAQPAPVDVASSFPARPDVVAQNVPPASEYAAPPNTFDDRYAKAVAAPALSPPTTVEDNVIAPIEQATVAPPVDVAPAVRQRAPATQTAYAEPSRQAPSMPSIDRDIGGVKASDAFGVGTGLAGITAAQSGPRGAFAKSLSDPNMGVISRGANLGNATYNSKFGTTTYRDPSGKTTGTSYDKPGGFLGALSRALGISGNDNDKGGGKSSGRSSSSSRGRGAFGGSTHSSNSVT